jgi:hypothetical protein
VACASLSNPVEEEVEGGLACSIATVEVCILMAKSLVVVSKVAMASL